MSTTVTVEQKVDANDIVNLLVTAFDGNMTSMWARAETDMPDEPDWSWCKNPEQWKDVRKCYVASYCGGSVTMIDLEDDDKRYRLDKAALEKGIKVMAEKFPRHFSDFLTENDDAITGDVYVQCCCFGDVIYG